jgi:hypothetical protein
MIALRAHHDGMDSLVIRAATASDSAALQRLAALDSRRLPAGPHLLAELDGRVVVALSRVNGSVVADPFARTDPIVALLRRRADQLADGHRRAGLRRLQPRLRLG